MPAATLRIMLARIISFWLMTSASAGTSRNVLMKYWLQRMGPGLYTRLRRGLAVAGSRGVRVAELLCCWVAGCDGGRARLSNLATQQLSNSATNPTARPRDP